MGKGYSLDIHNWEEGHSLEVGHHRDLHKESQHHSGDQHPGRDNLRIRLYKGGDSLDKNLGREKENRHKIPVLALALVD
jgi:hypothetical protein